MEGSGTPNLSVSFSVDRGASFLGKYIASDTSDATPALTSNNAGVYAAWKGSGNDNLSVVAVNLYGNTTLLPSICEVVSQSSGLVLTVRGMTDGVNIVQSFDIENANQQWQFVPVGSNFKIVSIQSGKVIEVPGSSVTPGAQIDQATDNGGLNQQWSLASVAAGIYKIVSASSKQVIDVKAFSTLDGTIMQQWPDNGGANQQWRLAPVNAVYKIVSVSSGKVLDMPGFSTADGTIVQQSTDNGGSNQQWRVARSPLLQVGGRGEFKIISQASAKVLALQSVSNADGVLIQQRADDGTSIQGWNLVSLGGDVFKIVSALSGKVFDVPGSSAADGVKIQQWTDNGGTNQQWRLVPIALPD